MAGLRFGEVHFKEAPAGLVRELNAGGSQFQYDSSYLETSSPPIAECFPRRLEPYNWPDGLHPFFQHLTAEGWLRDIQSRASRIANEDDFGLLLRFGQDCIGAVSVIGPAPPNDQPQISDPATAAALDGARTISGVQKKVLAILSGKKYIQAPATGPAPYIVKLPSDSLPQIVANEDLSLSVCRLLLGAKEVTHAHRGFVEGWPEQSLIVTRFDRTEHGERLRMEDFAQILIQPKGRDFQGKYESSYNACATVIQDHSSLPIVFSCGTAASIVPEPVIAFNMCASLILNLSLNSFPPEKRRKLFPGY